MSSLRTIRSFTVEILKTAADIRDSDIRKLLAERRGEEYLEGGRLATNTFDEAPPLIKSGTQYSSGVATGTYNLKANKKKDNSYQHVRDYATTGLKGALTGLAVLGASNALRGRFGGPTTKAETFRAMRQSRRAATIGGSAAVLDRAYRHNDFYKDKDKVAMVRTGINTSFRSPQEELARGSETGKFESRVIHDFGRPLKTVQLGRKFRIP
jgi:hypothetical protein